MTDLGKYCCFFCPESDFEEKRLNDKCKNCGKSFDFPLINQPLTVGEYKVISMLGRGFYGATFVAEKAGLIRKKNVLKIVPKATYEFFSKSFDEECNAHSLAAVGADYIVGIDDAFDAVVEFSGEKIECHVAVLQYIDGSLLQDFVQGKSILSAASVGQIAADLFRIREELAVRRQNHNDFHAGNIIIERLSIERLRQGAMDPSIRAMAIDLGSLSGDRRSGGGYKSDLHWIGQHVEVLATLLSAKTDTTSDLDTRLALALRMIAQGISPAIENQRIPSSAEFVRQIEDEFWRSSEPWRPWRNSLALRRFQESYNAQTLDAWNVPQLLVDPDDQWQKTISAPGPLIITGMRGCGKTMLLRALQFHARAAQRNNENDVAIVTRVRNDGYVGFFVSASSLLTLTTDKPQETHNMFARLAIAYALEAARSLAHLADIDSELIHERACQNIQGALTSILQGYTSNREIVEIQQLERHLVDQLNQACRSDSLLQIATHASSAFPLLASVFQKAASVWHNAQILFLLDDVSTRYLAPDQIEEILSALIFQKTNCAFKLTSETQTIFLSLKSPGGVEPAAHWRDFETFDLGSEVHKRLKRKGGKQFVEDILDQRAQSFSGHPHVKPGLVVGDQSLSSISKVIATSGPNSAARKSAYHGMSALKAVCVGDIGSIITIYENILNRLSGKYPVQAQAQSDVFQDFCSTHLYLLDRRGSNLKNVAKSFASASYELMLQSAKKGEARGLREYSSIYVRVTAGDKEEQGRRLRELVDAGVFVFQGGGIPRTKTKDSDPIQQFKLTFRKIYGLADFIGLSERDRFELSGRDLEDWLNHPDDGAEILMRNLSTAREFNDEDNNNEEECDGEIEVPTQIAMESEAPSISFDQAELDFTQRPQISGISKVFSIPRISLISLENAKAQNVETLFVALGFEERAYQSVMNSLDALAPAAVVAVSYPEKGRSEQILQVLESRGIPYSIIKYVDVERSRFPVPDGLTAIDITGFTKSAIFRLTTRIAAQNTSLIASYSAAEQYYPLEESLIKVLDAQLEKDYHSQLTQLKDVLTGEDGPYSLESLQSVLSDGTRLKALLAFGSAKHERLIHLTEDRDYDLIKVIIDSSQTARSRVAKLAAEVAVRGAEAGSIEECNILEPNEILQVIERIFRSAYVDGGLNFEIGLTGDKIEALVVAAFCSIVNVNNVWYVKPQSFHPDRFSHGTRDTVFYRIDV